LVYNASAPPLYQRPIAGMTSEVRRGGEVDSKDLRTGQTVVETGIEGQERPRQASGTLPDVPRGKISQPASTREILLDGRSGSPDKDSAKLLRAWRAFTDKHHELQQDRIRVGEIRRSTRLTREAARKEVAFLIDLIMAMQVHRSKSFKSYGLQLLHQSRQLEKKLRDLEDAEHDLEIGESQLVQAEWTVSKTMPVTEGSEGDRIHELLTKHDLTFPISVSESGESALTTSEMNEELSLEYQRYLSKLDAVNAIEEQLYNLEQGRRSRLLGSDIQHEQPSKDEDMERLREDLKQAMSELEQFRDNLSPAVGSDAAEQDNLSDEANAMKAPGEVPELSKISVAIDVAVALLGTPEPPRVFPPDYLNDVGGTIVKSDYVNSWLLHRLRSSSEEIARYATQFEPKKSVGAYGPDPADLQDLALRLWFDDQPLEIDDPSQRSVRTVADATQPIVSRSEDWKYPAPLRDRRNQTSANVNFIPRLQRDQMGRIKSQSVCEDFSK
jgi:hypothetical protein